MKFVHSFLLANNVCHASAGCDTAIAHISPVAATTAKIANVVVVISIYSVHIILYLYVLRQISKKLSEIGVLMYF